MPSKQSIVRRLNFCEWTEGESAWLAQEVWDAAQARLDFADYAGRKCHGGVDLSFKRDLTALSLVFDHDDGDKAAFQTAAEEIQANDVENDRLGKALGAPDCATD